MRTRDKKSFPHYSGKNIQWKSQFWEHGKIQNVKIAFCDYDIGYTLVNPKDSTDKFSCINGPSSPNKRNIDVLEIYEIDFQYLLDTVRKGTVYDVEELISKYPKDKSILQDLSIFVSKMAPCPFS